MLVGGQAPGSPPSGGKLRFDATVRGLAAVGSVDYLQWKSRSWHGARSARSFEDLHELPLARHEVVARRTLPSRAFPAYRTLQRVLHLDTVPAEVRIAPTPRRRDLSRAGLWTYDLVWCVGLASALSVRRAGNGTAPIVVDLVDPSHSAGWDIAARRVSAWADRTVLSNPDEARALGDAVVVIENGAAIPSSIPVHRRGSVPRLVFVGWMYYPPNEEAAEFLVRDVVPELRRALGHDFEVRIVGRAPAHIHALGNEPNVTVTGFVDDLEAELRAADVALIPLRHGAGTRIKILEAFAHCVPVVSTWIGAAGLAVEDGRHLLLADDPRALADACARVINDEPLRSALVQAARELVEARYDWRLIESQIARLAHDTMRPVNP
jgi:glycosyltransferase involved in cell wall biosynthesis